MKCLGFIAKNIGRAIIIFGGIAVGVTVTLTIAIFTANFLSLPEWTVFLLISLEIVIGIGVFAGIHECRQETARARWEATR